MRDPLSKTIVTIQPSGIRKFFDIVSEMKDAITLGVGEPDFDTPWHIRDEGIYSLEKGRTFYTSNAGLKELKIEIGRYLERRYGVSYNYNGEILVTVGGSEAIDIAMRAMLDPGDEVLIPQPSYVSYEPCCILANGKPVIIELKAENQFRLTAEELEDAITPKTKLLVLPFPNNPTGAIMEKADLEAIAEVIEKYGDLTDDLHTDLHECLGHGSGKLLEGVDGDSLKAYGSTIEEARADLFALYYLADPKLVELGLLPNAEAYKASYIAQMQNGLLTQLVRINLGNNIEEAHMRNRALIARWAFEHGKKDNVMELVKRDGKTFVKINDYSKLRHLFGELLAEIQRVKSTGDFKGAQTLVETYGVKIDPELHREILDRYAKLNIAPYKGFINPVYTAVRDNDGNITDVKISYTEGYAEQMLRYSKDYATLPLINE